MSINDNHTYGSCAFYVRWRQVNYDGEIGKEGRKRERDIAEWREGEKEDEERKIG